MGLNIRTTDFFEINKAKRFDAKYFSLKELIEKFENDNTVNLVSLGKEGLILEITDGEHNGQEFFNDGILFIKNSSIKDFGISVFDGFYVSKEKHEMMKRSALQEEDILFTTIGHLGSAAIVPQGFEAANINQNLVRIKVNKDNINPYYLTAFLNSTFVREQINYLFTGNIQSILTYPKIKSIKIILPQKEIQEEVEKKYKKAIELEREALLIIKNTQEYIKECLKIDDIIHKKMKDFSVSKNDLSKKTVWLPSYYNPKYDIILNYFKDNFKYKRLGEKGFLNINSGDEVGSDAYINYLEKSENDLPFIRTSDLYNYQLDMCPDNYVDALVLDELKQNVEMGDLLYTNDGKIGEMAIVNNPSKVVVQSHVKILKSLDKKIPIEYVFAMLSIEEIGKYQAEKNTVIQSTIPTLANRLKDFIIPILEQENINKIVNSIKKANKKFYEKVSLIKSIQDDINSIIR